MRLNETGEFEVRVEKRMGDLVQASRNPENQKGESCVVYHESW